MYGNLLLRSCRWFRGFQRIRFLKNLFQFPCRHKAFSLYIERVFRSADYFLSRRINMIPLLRFVAEKTYHLFVALIACFLVIDKVYFRLFYYYMLNLTDLSIKLNRDLTYKSLFNTFQPQL